MSVVLNAKPDRVKSQCNAPWQEYDYTKNKLF